jgi:hypothetical protein
MNNLWLKIRIWAKISIFSLVFLYAVLFSINNYGQSVDIWLFFGSSHTIHTYALRAMFVVFLFGIVSTLLFGTVRRTVRQLREVFNLNRAEQIQKERIQSAVAAAVAPNSTVAISDSPTQTAPPANPDIS